MSEPTSASTESGQPSATEILQDIKTLLEAGWTQGTFFETIRHRKEVKRSYCLQGAYIRCAYQTSDRDWCPETKKARDIMSKVAAERGFPSIIHLNDSPSMTQQQILQFMDICIKESM